MSDDAPPASASPLPLGAVARPRDGSLPAHVLAAQYRRERPWAPWGWTEALDARLATLAGERERRGA